MNDLINVNGIVDNNQQYIEKFLNYIDVSENTVKEYSAGLKRFFLYCKDNNINRVERNDIINFREFLKSNGKEANTINLYLASVKSFFKWLEYEGVYKDITRNIKSISVDCKHKREPLSLEQIKKVLSACQTEKEKLIIKLSVTTGLRCNELCNIRIQDFEVSDDIIKLYILGKARQGMRTDYVVIDMNLYQEILNFINKNNISEYLFISESNNNKGNKVSTRTIRNIVNKLFDTVGLKSNEYVFHSLRHSFCNINLKNNINIVEVSKAMRHKSINTTMRYVKDIEAKENRCFATMSNLISC